MLHEAKTASGLKRVYAAETDLTPIVASQLIVGE